MKSTIDQGPSCARLPIPIGKALLCALYLQSASMLGFSATVTLQPVADTTLFENDPNNNLGASDLASGTTVRSQRSRALIRFDLAGQVPANATVTSVDLTIRVTKTPPSPAPSTFGLHRLLQNWGEGNKAGFTGRGEPAATGDATWNARMFPDTLWSAPGAAAPGDFVAKVSASKFISGLGNFTFASTADLVADVQGWLANPQSNFGWILISQSESVAGTARRLGSREDPNNAPTLTIQFTAPAQATPPSITAQPQSQSVAAGGSVTFSVTATGTAPLSYQWKLNGNDLAGAASSTLAVNNVQQANAGNYTVIVSNSAGSVTSSAATLTVRNPATPPTITQQPQSQSVIAGANVTFTVVATGTAPLAFQWKFNNNDLPGATSPTLTLKNVQSANAGTYAVSVSNSAGSATSSTAILTVSAPTVAPTITQQPQSQIVAAGASVTFAIVASGTDPLSYQWKFEGANIPNATSPSLILNNVQVINSGNYLVVVSNSAGSATSATATLSVVVPPTISQQPQSQTVDAGSTVTFSIVAKGDAPLRYQWQFNGTDIPNATGPALSLSNVQPANSGSYTATVSNAAGSATSAAALLSVKSAPPPSRNRWTIMIYGHADHNLSGSLVVDMQEMEAAGSGPDFNIVLQADFDASSQDAADRGLPPDLAKGVTRFLMQKDNDPTTITTPPVERLPELNMDDPAVLTQFITWAAQKYPADRYGLVLWDHGGQWQGYGGDSQDGTLPPERRGGLSTAQIRQAVTSAMQTSGIKKWEFISFDTSLMGGAEVLADFIPLTDVFIACPEIDYGDGWDYEASFNFLKANPAVSPLDFGRAEVKAWEAQHMRPGNDSDLELAAHSLYDLTKFAAFEEKFDAFGTVLRQLATPQNLVIPRLRLDTTQYSLSGVRDIGKPTDFIDVGELADRLIADSSTDQALKTAAASLVSSIDAMVAAKVRGTKKQLAHGLSVYYPIAGAGGNQAYSGLTLSSKPGSTWSQFLAQVTANRTGDTIPPDIAADDVAPASLTNNGRTPSSFSASAQQPANIRVRIVNGADAYAIYASVVDNHFTGKTNEYVYVGEVLNSPVKGVGTYTVQWNGTLPMLSAPPATNSVVLGGFLEDTGSDILVSFAEYTPPKSTDTQFVALLTQVKGNQAKVIDVLDAESEDEGLAPEGIKIAPGGKLTPVYYLERRTGNDPSKWVSDDVLAKSSIVIPTNGLAGLVVTFAQVPDGVYNLEVQVADVYENESEVLTYSVSVGQSAAPQLTIQIVGGNKIKVSWPALATSFSLEANATLSSTGWTAVPANQLATEGANKAFTEATIGSARFYRLRKN